MTEKSQSLDIRALLEDVVLIKCSECLKQKYVEKGTWALDKGMCETCYCEYQGG